VKVGAPQEREKGFRSGRDDTRTVSAILTLDPNHGSDLVFPINIEK